MKSEFGTLETGETVHLFTLKNASGMEVKITNYGGIITSIQVPDKNGSFDNVVLGFDSLEGYTKFHPYFGAIVGRYANRIGEALFKLDGQNYTLAQNNGQNSLHGGVEGFDKKLWEAKEFEKENIVGVELEYTSPD
ncbi:MAG: galactose-1-epimerase, partial [Saprospiraceae bacterium]|nr:galactose-1-epimerase [Saprospiraceae bacterium]